MIRVGQTKKGVLRKPAATTANMLINNKLSAAISINVGPSTPLLCQRSKGAAQRS